MISRLKNAGPRQEGAPYARVRLCACAPVRLPVRELARESHKVAAAAQRLKQQQQQLKQLNFIC